MKSKEDMKTYDKDETYNFLAIFLFSMCVGYTTGKIVEFILTLI